ncbi:MAG: DUF4139 domain-containing protein [Planctomycetota bacterium]|nr:DUF4139 domain-containing protein [Planctomycetota bacterium]
MNPMIPLVLASMILPTGGGPASAEDSLVELSAPLREVLVFPEGAVYEHPGRIELPAGRSRIRMVLQAELPEDDSMATTASYHFATEGCTLLQSSVEPVLLPPDSEASDRLRRLLEEQGPRIRIAERALESARSSLELLDSMGASMSEQVDLSDPEAIRALHALLAEQRQAAVLAVAEQERTLTDETRRLRDLEEENARLHRGTRQLHAELLVDTENAGSVDLLATCFVEQAGWTPEVRITRTQARPEVQVELLADVTNDTNLDWKDVELRVSTERPDLFEPPGEVLPAAIDEASDEDEDGDGEILPAAVRAESGAARTLRAVHRTSHPTTIEAGRTRRVLLERFQTSFELRHHARPTVDRACHVLSTLRNESPRLISAAPVTLFLDGRMVGRTEVDAVAPGDEFEISWGIRPNLQITREVLDRTTKRIGLLGGGLLTTLRYRISIRNLEPEPLELILEDRLPTALTREITVKAMEFTRPIIETGSDEGDRLLWQLAIPPGGPDAAEETVEWTVEITHSADLETTPIPE